MNNKHKEKLSKNVLKDNWLDEVTGTVRKFLDSYECPHCKKLVDSIVVGKQGIRCEFCKNNNILEQISLAAKIENNSVKFMDFVESVSEVFEAEKDEEGKTINSPAFKVHMSEDIFDGDVNKFLQEWVSLFVFCKRDIAQLVIPEANVVKGEAQIPVEAETEEEKG